MRKRFGIAFLGAYRGPGVPRAPRRQGPARVLRERDPKTANIPYVAWAGNEIRLAKCIDEPKGDEQGSGAEVGAAHAGLVLRASAVEDWSGVDENNAGPAFLNAPNRDTVAYLEIPAGFASRSRRVAQAGYGGHQGRARIDIDGFCLASTSWQAPVPRDLAPLAGSGHPRGREHRLPEPRPGRPVGRRDLQPAVQERARPDHREGHVPARERLRRHRPDNPISFPRTGRPSPAGSALTTMPRTASTGSARCVGTSTTTAPRRESVATPHAACGYGRRNRQLLPRRGLPRRRTRWGRSRTTSATRRSARSGRSTPSRPGHVLSDDKLDACDAPMPALASTSDRRCRHPVAREG